MASSSNPVPGGLGPKPSSGPPVNPPPDAGSPGFCRILEAQSRSPISTPVNEKLWAHIFLDGQIRQTALEGLQFSITSRFIWEVLQDLQGVIPEVAPLIADIKSLDEFLDLKDLSASSERFAKKLQNLQPGEKALLPGGWLSSKDGHAMLYLFEKRQDGYNISIINTGDGILTYHPNQVTHNKSRASPYLFFKNVPSELVLPAKGSAWIYSLLSLQDSNHRQESSFEPGVIYGGVFLQFWKYHVDLEPKLKHFITPQRDGTCTWKSLLAYLRYSLPVPVYKRLKSCLRLYALHKVSIDKNLSPYLIAPALQVFAKEIDKKSGRYLSLEEGEKMHRFIEHCRALFPLPPRDTQERVQLKAPPPFFCPQNFAIKNLCNVLTPKINALSRGSRLPQSLPILLPKPNDILEQLRKINRAMSSTENRQMKLQIACDFAFQIPLSQDFWTHVSDRNACLQELVCYMRIMNIHTLSHIGVESPQELLAHYALYRHIFEICQIEAPSCFEGFVPYNPWDTLWDTPFFQVLPQGLRNRYQIITSLSASKNNPELFNPMDLKKISDSPKEDATELKFYRRLLREDRDLAESLKSRAAKEMSGTLDFARLSLAQKQLMILAKGDIRKNHWLQYFQEAQFIISAAFVSAMPNSITARNFNINNKSIEVLLTQKETPSCNQGDLWPRLETTICKNEIQVREALKRPQTHALEALTLLGLQTPFHYEEDQWVIRQAALSGVEERLKPIQLLSAFHAHPRFFENEDYRSLFWIEFFKTVSVTDGAFVHSNLALLARENPLLLDYMTQFVENGIDFFIDLQSHGRGANIEAALFYVRVATEFGYAAFGIEDESQKERYLATLERCQVLMNNLLANQALSGSQRGLLHFHILHLQLMLLEMEQESYDFPILFASWFGIHMFAIDPKNRQLGLEKVLYERMYPLLLKWQGEETTHFFSEAASTLFQRLELPAFVKDKMSWEKTAAMLHLKCGSLELDLFNGQILQDQQLVAYSIPDVATGSSIYHTLFGSDRFLYYSQGSWYLFQTRHGAMRLSQPSDLSTGLQLKIGDEWYEYVPRIRVLQESKSDIPYSLIVNHHHWIKEGGDTFIITDHNDWQTPIATIKKEEGFIESASGSRICRGAMKFDRTDLSVLDDSGFQEVHYEKNRLGEWRLSKIFFRRVKGIDEKELAFYSVGGNLVWGNDTRFVLDGTKPPVLPIEEFVTMTYPKLGKRKLLVSAVPFDKRAAKPFRSEIALNIPNISAEISKSLSKLDKFFYLEYDLAASPKGDYELIPQNVEGILFLAYLRIQDCKFDEVQTLLSRISLVDDLSPLSFQLLEQIVDYPANYMHHSPIPIAFALKAASIYNAHVAKRGGAPLKPQSLYLRYCDMESHIPEIFRLSYKQEVALCEMLPQCAFRMTHLANSSAHLEAYNDPSALPRIEPSLDCPFGFWESDVLTLDLFASHSFGLHVRNVQLFWTGWEIIRIGTDQQKAQLEVFLMKQLGYQRYMSETAVSRRLDGSNLSMLYVALKNRDIVSNYPRPPHCGLQEDYANFRKWGKSIKSQLNVKVLLDLPETFRKHNGESDIQIRKVDAPTAADLTLSASMSSKTSDFPEATALFNVVGNKPLSDISFPKSLSGIYIEPEYRPAVEREMALVVKDYQAGSVQLSTRLARTLPKAAVGPLSTTLLQKKERLEQEVLALEQKILEKANVAPHERAQKLHWELALQSGQKKLLTMSDLEKLFLLQRTSLFKKANPSLSQREIREIFNQIAEFELLQIQQIRLTQAWDLVQKITKIDQQIDEKVIPLAAAGSSSPIPTENELREMRELYCEQLAKVFDMQPSAFEAEGKIPYLVFHRRSKMYPRPDQRLHIENALNPKPCCIQMIMGSGKTSVVGPAWAYRCAHAGKLPVIFTDSALYGTLAQALKNSQHTSFGQEVFSIDYKREEIKENERLAYILKQLEEAIAGQKLLIMCPQMIQLLDLERFMAAESIDSSVSEYPNQMERIDLLNKICRLFKEQAQGLCDEADLLWRSDKEVNLPYGERQRISQGKISITRLLFQALCSEEIQIDGKTMKEYVGLEQKEQTHLVSSDWKKITPFLVKYLLENAPILKLKRNPKFEGAFTAFILGCKNDHLNDFMVYVEMLHRSADIADQEAADLICLVKHLIKDVLPPAFKQIGGRNFGRWRDQNSPVKSVGRVIPYLAADTPAVTEFGYHYEALVKHFMLAAQEGIEKEQIVQLARELEAMALQQIQMTNERFEETAEERFFKKLTAVSLLKLSQPGNLDAACAQVNSSLQTRLRFESETANCYVNYHDARVSSTAHDFQDLFGNALSGMTGTPWNRDGYPEPVAGNVKLDEGTQGKINRCILERKVTTRTIWMDPNDLDHELEKLYDQESRTFPSAILDAGALFSKSGASNTQIATAILNFLRKKGVKQRAVLFFSRPEGATEANQFTALIDNPQGPQIKLLKTTTWDEIQRLGFESTADYVLFLPERQTTGTDVPLPLLAQAYMTFDETMTMRTMHQTIMRLRDFLNKQTVHFILSPVLHGAIPKNMDPVDFILRKAVINEAREKASSQLRSYKQMFDAVVKKSYRRRIERWNTSTTHQEIRASIHFYRTFCFIANRDDLFGQFYGIEEEMDILTYLQRYKENLLKCLEQALDRAVFGLDRDIVSIKTGFDEIMRRARLNLDGFAQTVQVIPEKMGRDSAQQIEVLQEVQVVVEQEVEQEHELDIDLQNELQFLMGQPPGQVRKEERLFHSHQDLASFVKACKEGMVPKKVPFLRNEMEKSNKTRLPKFSTFSAIFEEQIHGTTNYFQPTDQTLSLFHPKHRPPAQILVIQRNDDSFLYILLSARDCDEVIRLFNEQSLEKVWLIQPNTRLFVPNPLSSLPLENPNFRKGVVELCFLQGVVAPLQSLKLMEEAYSWVAAGQHKESRMNFLKMRFASSPERLRLNKSGLLEKRGFASGQSLSVARAEEEMEKQIVPADIQMLTDPHVIRKLGPRAVIHLLPSQVPHMNQYYMNLLKEPEQIRMIPLEDAPNMIPAQVKHATAEQVLHLTDPGSIREIPMETLQAIEQKPSQIWLKSLSTKQLGWIRNESWIDGIAPQKYPFLSKELSQRLSVEVLRSLDSDTFESFSDEIILRVPERVKDLSRERIGKIQSPALVPHVKEVNDLPPSLALYIPDDRIGMLTNPHIAAKLSADKLHLLDPSICLICVERIGEIENPDFKEKFIIKLISVCGTPAGAAAIKKVRPETLMMLLPSKPELLSGYENPDILPMLDDFTFVPDNLVVKAFDSRHFEKLPIDLIPKANPNFASEMNADQRRQLTKAQVEGITSEPALRSLEDVSHVDPNKAHLLTREQRGKLSPEQIREITSIEALQSLEDVSRVNPNLVHLLTPAQRKRASQDKKRSGIGKAAVQSLMGPIGHKDRNGADELTPELELFIKNHRKLTTSIVALTALGSIAIIFALVLNFIPNAKLPRSLLAMKVKVGRYGIIGLSVGGGSLLLLAAIVADRKKKLGNI